MKNNTSNNNKKMLIRTKPTMVKSSSSTMMATSSSSSSNKRLKTTAAAATTTISSSSTPTTRTRYWLGVVSYSHVCRGVEGGFAQLCHGKQSPLAKMSVNDWLIYYSPKTDLHAGKPLQQFTAIGRVIGDTMYEYQMAPDFIPFRRDISYVKSSPASVTPLMDSLSFIKDNKKSWGMALRRGHFEITREDFEIIAKAMKAEV
jgi:hypothetical protein